MTVTTATTASPVDPINTTAARFGSGQAVRRLEDDLLLTGKGRFTDDVTLPDQAYLVFLRSPYPHARITAIDTAAALALPGVLQIVTGADLANAGVKPLAGVMGLKRADGTDCATPPRRALAHERVRFVGEPVAAVVAQTLAQARNATEAIAIDYDELPMVVHLTDATAPGAPVICDAAPDNISAEMRHGNVAATASAFAAARHVVKLDITNQRLAALTLEPRAVLAYLDAGRLTIRLSTQMPSGLRDTVCASLNLPKEQVRAVVGDVVAALA